MLAHKPTSLKLNLMTTWLLSATTLGSDAIMFARLLNNNIPTELMRGYSPLTLCIHDTTDETARILSGTARALVHIASSLRPVASQVAVYGAKSYPAFTLRDPYVVIVESQNELPLDPFTHSTVYQELGLPEVQLTLHRDNGVIRVLTLDDQELLRVSEPSFPTISLADVLQGSDSYDLTDTLKCQFTTFKLFTRRTSCGR
jgi:hypothetical protein